MEKFNLIDLPHEKYEMNDHLYYKLNIIVTITLIKLVYASTFFINIESPIFVADFFLD